MTIDEIMRLNEPPVHDELGNFKQVHIPVQHTGARAFFSTNQPEFLQPQSQSEHDDLLNSFYEQRVELPQWKEMGYEIEQEAPHYDSQDDTPRTDLRAQSSVIKDVLYDPNTQTTMLQIGEQLQRFFTAGSLGKEFNRIKKGYGSMMKTTSTQMPSISTVFGGL